MNSSQDPQIINQIIAYLRDLESRISRIESNLNLKPQDAVNSFKLPPIIPPKISERADFLELQIGQFWFAKVGIVILAIGIVFLLTFPYQDLPPFVPSIFGYVFVGALVLLSRYSSKSLPFLSQYIFGGGLLLLYFTTLRLHFFGVTRAIENIEIETFLLLIVSVVHLFISFKRKSVYLSSTGIMLSAITILLSNNTYSVFVLLLLLSFLIVYLKIKFEWNGFYIYGITLVYLTNFFWFINNPIVGNSVGLQDRSYINLFSFLLYGVIFSIGNFYNHKRKSEDSTIIVSTFINCFLSYGIFLLVTLLRHKEILPLSHFIASILFLILSVIFWVRKESKYSTFFYSILGYTALSVAIITQFPQPDFFVWLSWQSVVVVSTAIWFRSKIIIVANFVMYLVTFFSYLILAGSIGIISLSFGFVALLSARILNWQKNKLDLKTDAMRISYLAAAFFIFPYSLYHILPSDYVILSWTVVALSYYVLSVILKNKKYRWMALFTFLITILYILFVGTTNLEPSYRIISFIVLGIVLVFISIFYARMKSKLSTKSERNSESNTDKS